MVASKPGPSFSVQNKKKWPRILLTVLFFCMVLACYVTMLDADDFFDEMDVYSVGDIVVHGGDVYKVAVSQHMPFSYYIAALLGLIFRPSTVVFYRFCFYLFLALVWTGMFVHFQKVIHPLVFVLLPFFYLSHLSIIAQGENLISEHWAGIGHVILLLEILCYAKTSRLRLSSCLWISFAVLLTFGCVFPSAYAIACIAVSVFLHQIWLCELKTPRSDRPAMRRMILREDGKLVLCVLTPWAILILWYVISGNLQNFIYSAYTFNVEIYAEYTGGFGRDPLGTFLHFIPGYLQHLSDCFHTLFSADSFSAFSLFPFVSALCPLIVSCFLALHKPLLGLAYFLGTVTIPTRGYDQFHALHFICACDLALSLICAKLLHTWFCHRKQVSWLPVLAVGLIISFFFGSSTLSEIPFIPDVLNHSGLLQRPMETKSFVDAILDPGEKVHATSLEISLCTAELDRSIDYGCACSTPWTWEGFGEKEIAALEENQTKLVFYREGEETWGYERDKYALPLLDYLNEHYYRLNGEMLIRRSYLNEAVRRMLVNGYGDYIDVYDGEPLTIQKDNVYRVPHGDAVLRFTPSVNRMLDLIQFWPQLASPDGHFTDVTVSLTDTLNGELIVQNVCSGNDIVDTAMNLVYFDSVLLEAGHEYEIALHAETPIAFACDTQAAPAWQAYSIADGEKAEYVWRLQCEFYEPSSGSEWNEEEYDESYDDEEGI